MTIAGLSHADYILLAYGACGIVLALLALQSWQAFRAARRALSDAGLATHEKAPQ